MLEDLIGNDGRCNGGLRRSIGAMCLEDGDVKYEPFVQSCLRKGQLLCLVVLVQVRFKRQLHVR